MYIVLQLRVLVQYDNIVYPYVLVRQVWVSVLVQSVQK